MLQRTRALAALDLILSPEWDSRYYSFNSHWSENEQMASMRNGSGDEWFIQFSGKGWAGLKGLDHESPACRANPKLLIALKAAIPKELDSFANEPAFSWDWTTFAYYALTPDQEWQRVNDQTPFAKSYTGEDWLLELVTGNAEDYASYAEEYFEQEVDRDCIAAIFQLKPITDSVVRALNPKIQLADISEELFREIGYPN